MSAAQGQTGNVSSPHTVVFLILLFIFQYNPEGKGIEYTSGFAFFFLTKPIYVNVIICHNILSVFVR